MRGLSNQLHPAAPLLELFPKSGTEAVLRRHSSRPRQRQVRLAPNVVAEMVKGYVDGQTINSLSEHYLVSRTSVMEHLHKADIKTRYNILEDTLDVAVQLYADGWSLARIAEHFNVSPNTVLKALRREGVNIRPIGTNQWLSRD